MEFLFENESDDKLFENKSDGDESFSDKSDDNILLIVLWELKFFFTGFWNIWFVSDFIHFELRSFVIATPTPYHGDS